MEILWILLGLIVGVILTWYFLRLRFRAEIAKQETLWAEQLKTKESETAKERSLHQETKKTLVESEAGQAKAEQQATTLKSELVESRESLKKVKAEASNQKSLHEKTKTALEESQSSAMAAQKNASALKIEVAENHQALDKAKAETVAARNKIAVAQSETKALQTKLAAETAARSDLEEKLRAQKQAGDAAAAADIDTTGKVRRLESELTIRDQKINTLESELARLNQREARPSPVVVEPVQSISATRDLGEAEGIEDSDDLTRIKGIGQVLQNKLRQLGITSFRQIADFSPADIQRVNGVLDFPGRIERERWVEQARSLA